MRDVRTRTNAPRRYAATKLRTSFPGRFQRLLRIVHPDVKPESVKTLGRHPAVHKAVDLPERQGEFAQVPKSLDAPRSGFRIVRTELQCGVPVFKRDTVFPASHVDLGQGEVSFSTLRFESHSPFKNIDCVVRASDRGQGAAKRHKYWPGIANQSSLFERRDRLFVAA